MDTTIENLDTAITSASVELADISFGKEIAKTLILSAAATAGMVGGALAVSLALNKTSEFKQKRADKKAAAKATLVDVSDKTPANTQSA